MIMKNANYLQAMDEDECAARSFAWSGPPILDACFVQSDAVQLIIVTSDGALHSINLEKGESSHLCTVKLPDCPPCDDGDFFGPATYRLHATLDGRYAAIVVDKGRKGVVVETLSGKVTMHLDGGDYYEETVPFSACFVRFEGRNVLVHRTAWNRLDTSDPATGELLTKREIAPYETASPPEHYLDYFHGQILPSADGSRIFDDGWVWHPSSIPRTWSVTKWLGSNPWESEDGDSIVDLTMRDDWNTPACWISDRHLAVWGLAEWDDETCEEVGQGPGVRIFDASAKKQSVEGRWPMPARTGRVFNMFSDGQRIFVAEEAETTVWEIASRSQIAAFPNFSARFYSMERGTLIAVGRASIVERPLPW